MATVAHKDRKTVLPGVTVPAGYKLQWPHASYDLLKKINLTAAGPAWHVVCNAHKTLHPAGAASGPKGDKLGSAAQRPTWCKGCKA